MEIENTRDKLLSELDCIAHDDLNPDAMMLALYRFLAAQRLDPRQVVELFYRGSRELLERLSQHVTPAGLGNAVAEILKDSGWES